MLRENLNFGSGFPDWVFSFGPRAAFEKTSDFLHRNGVKNEANNQWPSLVMSEDELFSRLGLKAILEIVVSVTSTRRARTSRLTFSAPLLNFTPREFDS